LFYTVENRFSGLVPRSPFSGAHQSRLGPQLGKSAGFTEDGTFTDESIGVTYRGKQLSQPVEIYAAAFPDMHRELYRFFVDGDTVIVELALQGTQKGPLKSPLGTIQPTGKRMDAPCCDVFRLKNGKIQSFNCYPSGTVIFAQLGVLSNIEAAIVRS
jgi:predicted ester cyclase